MANYTTEKQGQQDFFIKYGIWDPNSPNDENVKLINNTDGIYKGVIFEFKIQIGNYNAVLYQAIKYLSSQRIKGQNIPKNILLISLNEEKAFLYNSADFIEEIEKVYVGGASKHNNEFLNEKNVEPIIIKNIFKRDGMDKILEIMKDVSFTKINIDQICVVGWAERYYKSIENATKTDFFHELKNPTEFRDFINPWKGSEEDFKYIMDLLNDPDNKAKLGAFYTPKEYTKYSYKMIKQAINEVPNGNDYVIIDRCAGSGNLEELFTDEELSHTIVSTYELWEWVVLNKRIGDKVKLIIPPQPNHENGLLTGGDAMSQPIFKECLEYVNDPKCTVILLENPPYRDETTNLRKTGAGEARDTFVKKAMKESTVNGRIANELSSQFIWSAFEYYLKKEGDSLILYSPIKYWKSQHLINKEFKQGYLLNRKFFHASESAISLIWWKNSNEVKELEELTLQPITLIPQQNNAAFMIDEPIVVKKVYNNFNSYFDNTRDKENYIAMLNVSGFNLDNASGRLLRRNEDLKGHGTKKLLYPTDFYTKLPLFAAKKYIHKSWTEKDVIFTTSDGGKKYLKDEEFLRKSAFWVAMTQKNECFSYYCKDQVFQNELVFSNIEIDGEILHSYKTEMDKYFNNYKFDNEEKKILTQFAKIHKILRGKELQKQLSELYHYSGITKFDKNLVYGSAQINKLFNLNFKKDELGNNIYKETNKQLYNSLKGKTFKMNDMLNTELDKLNKMTNKYYETHISKKLFKYELLK
ncbi:hypothetical protein H9M94_00670 [Mycoplasma sp. Pen4]|uniref:hypothetical protein n=1 Tax=Mycoplasma sp. Pen4 TaxID=640330 RepID=UPI0016543A7A|nr:hypothetical protein [Mycoplasma sp. Pen4]QNM93777.1 hypothetical protein H9M94_00670 [Mycoplasma sp. Pen4]